MEFKQIAKVRRGGWSSLNWSVYDSEWHKVNFLEEKDANDLLTLINSIQSTMPNITNANILIDKTSDIPRPKLKEFIEDKGHKKVTLLSKADIVVVRRETVKLILNNKYEDLYFVDKKDYKKLKSTNTNSNVFLDLSCERGTNMDQEWFDVKNNCTIEKGMLFEGYRSRTANEGMNFLMSLVGTTATLVYDDVLLNTLNAGGIDLDDEIYETLRGMLLSRENETFTLGIEMLGNVNLEKNLFRISLLMNEVNNTTSRFNALSQYQSKNFKSLLSYLESNGIKWNQGWERYGMSMWNKFKDTGHAYSIKNYMVRCMNNNFKKLMGNDAAEIADIVFK